VNQQIEEFIQYLGAEKGLSSHTQAAYKRDLYQLYTYIKAQGKIWPPQAETIVAFIETQNAKKPTSLARAIVACKVFLKYLFREEQIERDESLYLETPKLWQTIPNVLSDDEIDRLLHAPDLSQNEGIRDAAILELLYGTGIRVSELCKLSIYDVSDDAIKVFGKGEKERIVPLGTKAKDAIDRFLVQVRCAFESEIVRALFVTEKGKPIDRFTVWQIVKRYARKANIEKSISPHTFRHTYASHLLDAGADLRIIQELLGHASISSTDRYTHVSKSQIRELFRAFHPRW
jgi:integrase/recombinase XerD